ncbi:hypothetical protein ACFL27_13235, partial [candidate division CSSED10-310 bacterium]
NNYYTIINLFRCSPLQKSKIVNPCSEIIFSIGKRIISNRNRSSLVKANVAAASSRYKKNGSA